jgi:hypothetical protein
LDDAFLLLHIDRERDGATDGSTRWPRMDFGLKLQGKLKPKTIAKN